ncbi:sugar ABC transporter permease [Oceanithermus sp.]
MAAAYFLAVRGYYGAVGERPNSFLVYGLERGHYGVALAFALAVVLVGLALRRWLEDEDGLRVALWTAGVLELGAYTLGLGLELASRVQPHPAFGSIFIPGGWRYVLAGYAVAVLVLFVYSWVVIKVGNRLTGRRRPVGPLFGQALTHLFMWTLVVLVYYPVLQVVSASFDPRNNLFSFRKVESSWLLVRAKVLPSFSNVSWANYAKLVDGVVIYPWQWAVLALALGLLLAALLLALLARRGGDEALKVWHGRALFGFAAALFVLVVFLSPDQFTGVGTESKFLLWVRNTLLVSSSSGLLAIALTATAGYAFARFDFPGRYPTLLTFIFIQMFPGFLALVAIYYLLSWLDLLNTFTGLLLAYSGGIISFGSWVYKGYVESLGRSLEEAAYIDGATRWQAFTRIVLPLSAPMFVFIFLLQFVGTYSEFIMANLVLTGVDKWTVGLGLYSFTTGQFSTKWGLFAAASVLGSLPILLIFYGFQQYFVSGYTAGAVKE